MTTPTPRMTGWIARGALALAVVVGAVACSTTDSAAEDVAAGDDAGPVHAHGIAVDPADGAVYLASHYGLFVVERDRLVRIDGPARDYMGFTIAGPGHFYASGHPAARGDDLDDPERPPLLGLLESTDAGRTWMPRSLLGEADFHALRAVGGTILGWDATTATLLASDDGTDWETRASIGLLDLAVDPSDPDSIVATADTLLESDDGARSWRPSDGSALVWLDWHADAGLWGTDTDGTVWRRDRDAAWVEQGSIPELPEALAVVDGRALLAARGGTVWRSDDAGASWEVHAQWSG